MKSIEFAAVVQAASAAVIVLLTWGLVRATSRYVTETQRIARSTSRGQFVETLPVLALTRYQEGVQKVTVGAWKNVGRGPAINVELAIEGNGQSSSNRPSEWGASDFDYDWRAALVQGDELPFSIPGHRGMGTFLARYQDIHGNRYLSAQRGGTGEGLRVSKIEGNRWDQWDGGTLLSDVIASQEAQ